VASRVVVLAGAVGNGHRVGGRAGCWWPGTGACAPAPRRCARTGPSGGTFTVACRSRGAGQCGTTRRTSRESP